MATLLDYLTVVKDTPFAQEGLNILDKTCLNEIGYIPFEKWLTESQLKGPTPLKPLYEGFDPERLTYSFMVTKERIQLLGMMLEGERFADLSLSTYHSVLDQEFEKQFAAMVFKLPSLNYQQMVFRGTDDTLIGWKEDFQLTYSREIPAHRSAISYLKTYLTEFSDPITLSGHSKGGNLALYASVHATDSLRQRIAELVLLDSPGLMASELQRPAYEDLMSRTRRIRPQDSIVGIMLYWNKKAQLVDAQGIGIAQHNVLSWQVDLENKDFVEVDQATEMSRRLEQTFQEWIEVLPNRELKQIFDILFDTLMDSGIQSLDDLTLSAFPKLAQTLQSFGNLTEKQRRVLQRGLHQMLMIFWQTNERRPSLGRLTLPDLFNRRDS